MQKDNPVLEDISRLMSSVAGTVAGVSREAEARMKEKFRESMAGMDFVSRDEFEAVKEMAATARAEVEALRAEVAAMQAARKPAKKAD